MNLKGWTKLSAHYYNSILYLNVGLHCVLILPWFGCYRHFSQTNKLLEKAGHLPIDWQLWNYNPCILATVFSRFLAESAKLSGDCLSHIHGDDVLHFCSAVGELCHKFAFTKGYRDVLCFCSAVWVLPQICLHKRLQGLPHFCSAVWVFPYICLHKKLQGLPTSVPLFEFSHTFAFTKGYRVCHTCSAVWVFPYICLSQKVTVHKKQTSYSMKQGELSKLSFYTCSVHKNRETLLKAHLLIKGI